MKKLCVVSDVIGNSDVIHNGKNGFVCNTVEQFTNIIKSQIHSIDCDKIEQAYEDVKKHYNTKVMSKAYGCIYNSTCK